MSHDPLRFPVGPFVWPDSVTPGEIHHAKEAIKQFPDALLTEMNTLPDSVWDIPYRDGGWTVRQVVHHLADSHMNAYIRFKIGLTEEMPTIRPYKQDSWADLADSSMSPMISIPLIQSIHKRWGEIMDHMSESDWLREVIHPEHSVSRTLAKFALLYSWHGKHHLGHILIVKRELGH